jgi:hypothetical protein
MIIEDMKDQKSLWFKKRLYHINIQDIENRNHQERSKYITKIEDMMIEDTTIEDIAIEEMITEDQ